MLEVEAPAMPLTFGVVWHAWQGGSCPSPCIQRSAPSRIGFTVGDATGLGLADGLALGLGLAATPTPKLALVDPEAMVTGVVAEPITLPDASRAWADTVAGPGTRSLKLADATPEAICPAPSLTETVLLASWTEMLTVEIPAKSPWVVRWLKFTRTWRLPRLLLVAAGPSSWLRLPGSWRPAHPASRTAVRA